MPVWHTISAESPRNTREVLVAGIATRLWFCKTLGLVTRNYATIIDKLLYIKEMMVPRRGLELPLESQIVYIKQCVTIL